jgi:protease PrsW
MKLKITIQNGSLTGRTADLENGFLTIGRDVNCNVRFDANERVVSSKHAFIEAKPDGFYLTDNNSTNGTYLNGSRIQSQKLNSGDVIQFGRDGIRADVYIESEAAFAPPFQSPTDFSEPPSQATQLGNWRNSMTQIGIAPPIQTAAKPVSSTGRYVGIGVTIFVVVFLALIVVAMVTSSLGIIAAFIAAVVAFIPACVYILPLVWLDRYDPEPLWLLALSFAWGALVAIIFSATVNDLMAMMFGQLVAGVISAPVFEEGSKGVGLLILLIFFRRHFDDILDGIVFAGIIALGFATVENVLYYGRALLEGGFGALAVLFFLRGVLSPFAHVTFTAMIGIGCGIARESHNTAVRILLPLLGYVCAVLLHALWNGMAFIGGFGVFLVGYLIIEIPFFLIFWGFSAYVMNRQNKILREMLAIDVARGLITQEQLDTVTSAVKSSTWILGSIGTNKFKPRQRFLRAVGKLGLSYWHIQRATAAQGQTGSFQQNPVLREEVIKWRDKI